MVKEIAKQRELAEATIHSHLQQAFLNGEAIDIPIQHEFTTLVFQLG